MTHPNPLAEWDAKIAPLIVLLNKVRQYRDSFPEGAWLLIPNPFRSYFEAIFDMVEGYDRWIGQQRENGLLPPKEIK